MQGNTLVHAKNYKYILINAINYKLMFLTKKTAALAGKNKDKNKKTKALGGWGDDEGEEPSSNNPKIKNIKQTDDYLSMDSYETAPVVIPNYGSSTSPTYSAPPVYETTPMQIPTENKQNRAKRENMFYTGEQLKSLPKIECQRKLVEGITQPGGIRIKPNEQMLSEFLDECKSLDIGIIGSLLIDVLNQAQSFQGMAKSLYTIEYLCKKRQHYLIYFKLHNEKLKDCNEPPENIDNFRKIKKNVMCTIGDVFRDEDKNEDFIEFSDPGYAKQKGIITDLLQNSSLKKKKNEEMLEFSDPGYNTQDVNTTDLLSGEQNKPIPVVKPQKQKTKKLISPGEMKKKLTGPKMSDKSHHETPAASIHHSQQNRNKDENLLDFNEPKKVEQHKKGGNLLDFFEQESKNPGTVTFDQLIAKKKPLTQFQDLKL